MNNIIRTLLNRIKRPDDPSSDAVLLSRFVQERDEAAFELLVWRHGGYVLSICKRILRNLHSAEDAFQATFLILARKAGSVRGHLPGWLHRVARNVCLRANKKKWPNSHSPLDIAFATASYTAELDDVNLVLDEEIARLPERFRSVIILCYLQGRTTEDACKLLDIPRGTVLSRLDTAKKKLRDSLTQRGITVPVALFGTATILPELSATVCKQLATTANTFAVGSSISTASSQLALEVITMTKRKILLGIAATALIATTGIGTGVGWISAQAPAKVAEKKAAEKAEEKIAEKSEPLALAKSTLPLAKEQNKARDEEEAREKQKAKAQALDNAIRNIDILEKEIMILSDIMFAESEKYRLLRLRISEIDHSVAELEYSKKILHPDNAIAKKNQVDIDILKEQKIEAEKAAGAKNDTQINLVKDKIEVLRDIRKQLLRKKIMLEVGLE